MTIKSSYDSVCALEHFFLDQSKKNGALDPSNKVLYMYSQKVQQIIQPGFKKPLESIQLKAFKNSNGKFSRVLQWTSDCLRNDKTRAFFGRVASPEKNKVLINQRSVLKRLEKMEHHCLEDYVKQIHYAPLEGNVERIFEEKRRAFALLKERIERSSSPVIKGLDPKISDFSFTASISEKTFHEVFDHASNPTRYVMELQTKYPFDFTPSVPNPPLANPSTQMPAGKSLLSIAQNAMKILKSSSVLNTFQTLTSNGKRVSSHLQKTCLAAQRMFENSRTPPEELRHFDFSF